MIDAAKAVAIPMDREVIHVIPQEFIIDDQDGIREPLGMSGVRLEAKIHIVTAAVTSAQNIVKCANKAGLNVIDIVLEPLASAEAVLADDERELGVCLIDIGGGTTDLAVFGDGSIKHTVGAGARRLPHHQRHRGRAAHALRRGRAHQEEVRRAPRRAARQRRRRSACRASAAARPREVSRKILCEIIEPRVEEILSLARQELVQGGPGGPHPVRRRADRAAARRSAGIAGARGGDLRGAGARRACRRGSAGCRTWCASPMYATGVGLVLYGANQAAGSPYSRFRIRDESIFRRVTQRMRDWFYGEFE